MSLGRYRSRLSVKGLGTLEVREVDPVVDAAFSDVGYIGDQGTEVGDVFEVVPYKDERGNMIDVLDANAITKISTKMMQTSSDEMNLIKNATGKLYAIRYSGMSNPTTFHYFCIESGRIVPMLPRGYHAGKQLLDFVAYGLKQDPTTYDIPEFYLLQTGMRINPSSLSFWISPRHGYTAETAKILDVSGFARHGTLNSDYTTIWQGPLSTPDRFLRFDGVNDECDFGDVCDDDGVSDFLIDGWFRVQKANGNAVVLVDKIGRVDVVVAGWGMYRGADNTIYFRLAKTAGGGAYVEVQSAATVLQNVWTHIAVAIDRNGNGQIYINGVASGVAVDVSAITTAANAISLKVANRATIPAFSQIDADDLRIQFYGAGNLPSDIASICLGYYTAEKGDHGL